MICSATYDDELSRVRLSATDINGSRARIERSTDGVNWTIVRGSDDIDLSGTAPTSEIDPPIDDYEFATADPPSRYPSGEDCPSPVPPGVENIYRFQAYFSDVLNSNPTFETDVSGWTEIFSVLSHSTAQAHTGSGSMLITPSGTDPVVGAGTDPPSPVASGNTYSATAWIFSEDGWSDILVGLLWLDSGGSPISESLSPSNVSVPAATWTEFSVTDTPPSGATDVLMRVLMTNTPSPTDELFVDDATLRLVDGEPVVEDECTAFITPILDGVWLKSIYQPFLNQEIVPLGAFQPVARGFRGGVFNVIGRDLPVAVTDVRASRRWVLRLATNTADEAWLMDAIIASGDPLFLHIPNDSTLPIPSMHIVIDQDALADKRWFSDQRAWNLPFIEVAAPGSAVVGSTVTWQTVLNTYTTWQDVLDNNASWSDLLQTVADPSQVLQ